MRNIVTLLILCCLTSCYNRQSEQSNISTSTTDSVSVPSESNPLLESANKRGFKTGVIQHALYTKWSEFGDRGHYTHVKTLKSGMKLYRTEIPHQVLMEIYVLDDMILLQSSTFITFGETSQIYEEMKAWLSSCKPKSKKDSTEYKDGEVTQVSIYTFKGYDATLKKHKDSIHYLLGICE